MTSLVGPEVNPPFRLSPWLSPVTFLFGPEVNPSCGGLSGLLRGPETDPCNPFGPRRALPFSCLLDSPGGLEVDLSNLDPGRVLPFICLLISPGGPEVDPRNPLGP